MLFSAHTHEYTHDPTVVEETETVVVESGVGDALGRVDLRVDADGGLAFRHELYCLVEGHEYTPAPDPEAERVVADARRPFLDGSADDGDAAGDGTTAGEDEGVHHERGAGTLDRPIDAVVGRTETPLHRRAFLESGWNRLFAGALRAHFEADLAVTHGFRYGPTTPPGELTLEHLYRAFPMTTPVASGMAYGQQLSNHLEHFLTDNFTPYVYEQEDGRVRNFSSNVDVVVDPTAKRGRRLVELRVDGEPVDLESR